MTQILYPNPRRLRPDYSGRRRSNAEAGQLVLWNGRLSRRWKEQMFPTFFFDSV